MEAIKNRYEFVILFVKKIQRIMGIIFELLKFRREECENAKL